MAQYFLLKIAQLLAFSFQQQLKLFDIWVWLLCTMKSCDGLLTSIFSRGLETQLIRPLPQSSWRMAAETTRMKRWRRAWWRGVVGISRISCNLYLEICSMSSNRVTMNGSIHWSLASNVTIQPTKHVMLRVWTHIYMHIQRIDSPHDESSAAVLQEPKLAPDLATDLVPAASLAATPSSLNAVPAFPVTPGRPELQRQCLGFLQGCGPWGF